MVRDLSIRIAGILIVNILVASICFGQKSEIIDVTEQTLKLGIGAEQQIELGFAAGDKIVFNFKEANGKEVKEVEIIEYPTNSRFSDFKTDKVENKIINVLKQGVYIFRFKSSALSARICKIQIQRIPATEATKDFNTAVSWIQKQDTTWNSFTKDEVVGYDTVYEQKIKKILVSSSEREEMILDKSERVHSRTNGNSSSTAIFFTLPQNVSVGNTTKKIVAWAYWVGVGEEANKAWQNSYQSMKNLTNKTAVALISPLGALAVGLIMELATPSLGEDVSYALTDEYNKTLFLGGSAYRAFDHGKGKAGFRRFTEGQLSQGTYFICLNNDNFRVGIDAIVKVSVIVEVKQFEDKQFTETVINPRYEKKLHKEPIIKTYKQPVTGL